MHPKLIVANAVLAAAVVAAPLAASAQPYPGNHDRYQWCQDHPRECRDRDRDRDRDERRDDRGPNNGYNNGYGNGYSNGRLQGRVTNFSPYNLDINNGPHIKLHNGTVIHPTGTSLQPGETVMVYGHPNGDGTFEADRIDVVSNGRYNGGYNGGRYFGR